MSEDNEERPELVVGGDPVVDRVDDHHAHVGVQLIGGSPAFTLDGQPVAWFENWIRARTRRERMR